MEFWWPLYILWVAFIVVGCSNAVNLTDGLDGLAAGLSAIACATFGIFAYLLGRIDASDYLNVFYLPGAGELTIFCLALAGGCMGFLWYNAHPAEVFMGDTGSLAIGGVLGAVAIMLKAEFLLAIVGAVFVAEALSVASQTIYFKWTKSRTGVGQAHLPHGAAAPPLRADRLAREQGDHPLLDRGGHLRHGRLRHAQDPLMPRFARRRDGRGAGAGPQRAGRRAPGAGPRREGLRQRRGRVRRREGGGGDGAGDGRRRGDGRARPGEAGGVLAHRPVPRHPADGEGAEGRGDPRRAP